MAGDDGGPPGYPFRNRAAIAAAPAAECPPGWTTGPPEFVGVGCQRCGTTRWWSHLVEHPQIHRTPVKELHFFDRLQGATDRERVVRDYHRRFCRPPGLLCGEWTPRYVLDHWTPPLLAAAAPEATVLVLLRDPVERFLSGLAWQEHLGWAWPDGTASALLRSDYLPQLRHLLRHVRRDRLVLLQFERCVVEPEAELARTYAALGVDPGFRPADLGGRVNPGRVEAVLTATERRQLVGWLEESVSRLGAEFPEIDLALWPNFAHLAR